MLSCVKDFEGNELSHVSAPDPQGACFHVHPKDLLPPLQEGEHRLTAADVVYIVESYLYAHFDFAIVELGEEGERFVKAEIEKRKEATNARRTQHGR